MIKTNIIVLAKLQKEAPLINTMYSQLNDLYTLLVSTGMATKANGKISKGNFTTDRCHHSFVSALHKPEMNGIKNNMVSRT